MSGKARHYYYPSQFDFWIDSRILQPLIVAAAVLGGVCSCGSLVAATGQSSPDAAVEAPEDFAGIYLDRYVPPAPELAPSKSAQRKSRAFSSYYFGLLKEQSGDRAGAVAYYRKVLKQDPSSVGLADRAARIAALDGDIEAGLSILQESLAQNPDDPSCYLILSSYYATFIDHDDEAPESIRVAKDAFVRFPDDPRIIRHLIITLIGFEKNAEAEEILGAALAKTNKDPAYWYRLGRIAQAVWPLPEPTGGAPERINAIYEKALALARDDAQITESVADYFYASGQHQRASEIYIDIIEHDHDCISPREKLGRIHAINNEIGKAIEVLSELLEVHPDLPNTHKLLAHIYTEKDPIILENKSEDYLKAVDHFEAFLRLSIGDSRDYIIAAALMLGIPDRAEQAVNVLERARLHFPDNGDIYRMLGIAYHVNRQYEEAISTFEEAVNLATESSGALLDYEFYYHYAAAYERLKNFAKATELFRKAISLVPPEEPERMAHYYNYLGYMWLEQGINIEEAGELIVKANEIVPNEGAYVDSLGWFYFMERRFEEALTVLLKAAELLGEEFIDAVVIDHIAQSYFELKKFDEAIAYEERATKLDPEGEEYPKRLEQYRKAKETASRKRKSENGNQKAN